MRKYQTSFKLTKNEANLIETSIYSQSNHNFNLTKQWLYIPSTYFSGLFFIIMS